MLKRNTSEGAAELVSSNMVHCLLDGPIATWSHLTLCSFKLKLSGHILYEETPIFGTVATEVL